MKLSKIWLSAIAASIIVCGCFEKNVISEVKSSVEDFSTLNKKQFPYEQQFIHKNFPYKTPDYRAYKLAKEDVSNRTNAGARSDGKWKVEGPGNIGARVNTIAVNPNNSDEIIAGFASGGVFRTVDNGTTWQPVFDDQADLNIGEITYDPNNPSIIYVGTGDPNISGYPKIGSGIFKSTDGGGSWNYKGLEEASIISRIHVAPSNSDIIYVSTMGLPFIKTTARGVYKSTDGGDSWQHKLMINDSTGVIDMVVHPEDNNILYAAGWNRNRSDSLSRIVGPDARIHKSIDGGDTWTMLEGGLPIADQMGRIGLTISGQDYDNIYASYVNTGGSDSCSNSGSQLLGIWKTNDAGDNWTEINTLPDTGFPCNALGGFAWYFGQVRVNPNDDNDIFVLGVDMWRTKDGGSNWERAVPSWSTYAVHADKHDLIFDGIRMILATDGGIYESTNDAENWVDIENIVATQFYRIGYNPHRPDWYYGGAQDNGTSGGNAEIINEWPRLSGGDGFTIDFDPSDSMIYYVLSQNGNLRVTFDGGDSFDSARSGFDNSEGTNWDTPYFVSKHDPKVLYAGRQSVYKGFNDGEEVKWSKISDILTDTTGNESFFAHTISTVHQSPLIEEYLYAGTTDGLVWSSIDAGQTWDNVSEGIPYRYVSDIVASPSKPNSAYVSVTGYKSNDFVAHIHRTDDNGQTWIPISGDLPQIAINDILLHPEYDDNVIFVATDGGIYFTVDAGESWDRLGDNMPIIEVYDMVYNPVNNELVAGTFARGIQTFDLEQVNLDNNPSNLDYIPEFAISLYPTVTTNQITAKWSDCGFEKYFISSTNCRLIEKGQVVGDMLTLDVSYLSSGSYVLTLESNDGAVSKQFVKI